MAMMYEKRETTLAFKDDKPTVYKLAPVRQQQVPFDALLDEVSTACGVNRAQVKAAVEALIDRMSMFMNYNMGVKMGEFGSFKPTFNSKSESTADALSANNVTRRKILFYLGKRFKTMLSNISIVSSGMDDDEEEGGNPGGGGGTGGSGEGGADFE